MIVDIEQAIGETGGTGCGRTVQNKDGTWVAFIIIDDGDTGIYGAGASEGHALSALQCKLKALGGICSAAYAEAECRQQVRKMAEGAEMADKLEKLMGLLGGGPKEDRYALPGDRKREPEGGN